MEKGLVPDYVTDETSGELQLSYENVLLFV
jgi:hypothetical protein